MFQRLKKASFLPKTILGATLIVFTAMLLTFTAQAQSDSGRWIDKDTIEYNGNRYNKREAGSIPGGTSFYFLRQGDSVSCPDEGDQRRIIDSVTDDEILKDAKATHKLQAYSPQIGDGCITSDTKEISVAKPTDDGGGGKGDETGDENSSDVECDSGAFTWFICPAIDQLTETIGFIEDKVIKPFLKTEPISFNQENPTFKMWTVFKNLANVAFVIVFLVIAFANTMSYNIDAYTIRKMLPRLVAAAILVQFSYLLAGIAIDITNVLGEGMLGLVDQVLDPKYKFGGFGEAAVANGLGIATIIGAVALAGSVLTGTFLIFLLGAFFGVLAVFLTIVFRQILITMLIILAPVAFVLWVLPNTERYFRKWAEIYLQTLFMYPLIILLFIAGKIFSVAADATGGTLSPLFALAGLIVPLFMIPLTFKFAGAAMIMAGGFLGKAAKFGQGRVEGTSGYERLKTRVGQRKAELGSGQGVKVGFGRVGGRVGKSAAATQLLGRGVVGGWGAAGDVRSMMQFARQQREWGKRLEDEGFSYEAYQALSRGGKWIDRQVKGYTDEKGVFKDGIKQKIEKAESEGDTGRANTLRQNMQRLQEGKATAERYMGSSEARAAATYWLGDKAFIDDEDRKALDARMGQTKAGRMVANQVWGQAKAGARDNKPHLLFTDIKGNLDHEAYHGYMKGQNQNKMSNFKEDAWRTLFYTPDGTIRPNAHQIIADIGGAESVDKLLNGPGPRVDAKSAELIRRAMGDAPAPPAEEEPTLPPEAFQG